MASASARCLRHFTPWSCCSASLGCAVIAKASSRALGTSRMTNSRGPWYPLPTVFGSAPMWCTRFALAHHPFDACRSLATEPVPTDLGKYAIVATDGSFLARMRALDCRSRVGGSSQPGLPLGRGPAPSGVRPPASEPGELHAARVQYVAMATRRTWTRMAMAA